MKKIIIVLFILLSSCTANVGDLRTRTLVITESKIPIMSVKSAVYTAKSYNGNNYTNSIKFTDNVGKYKVGDTIKIVKR